MPPSQPKACRDEEGNKGARLRWTQFTAPEPSDYPIPHPRYMALEARLVSWLCGQNTISPNQITMLRIVIALGVALGYRCLCWFEILLLALAGILTDFVDGAYARAASKKTPLGTVLDPLADKLLAFALLFVLLAKGALPAPFLLLMLLVEMHVVLIPLLSRVRGKKRGAVGPLLAMGGREMILGKIKTLLYGLAFVLLIFAQILSSALLARVALGFLVSGIVSGGLALGGYLRFWSNWAR